MTSANQVNIDHWNSPHTMRWVTEQERLDRVLGQLDDVAIPRAAPRAGERVVDIGCGCGASALRLAELVGPSGSVLGIDVSRIMLAHAQQRARNLPQLTLREADATDYAFASDADLLYSRLGVMFFAEPERAFANMRRALRPGGRLCFVCWRSSDENPWYHVPLRAAAHLVELPAPAAPGSAGPFSFAAADRLRGVLQAGGFSQIALEPFDLALRLSTEGLEDAVHFALGAGPLARALMSEQVPPEVTARVRAAVRAALASHVEGNTVALGAGFWIATAHA
jgi:SAM-dependent methyltransferase